MRLSSMSTAILNKMKSVKTMGKVMVNPWAAVGIFISLLLGTALGEESVHAQGLCENYLVLPSGRQICFDQAPVRQEETSSRSAPGASLPAAPFSENDFPVIMSANEGYVAYLDQLRSCSPYVAELPFPSQPEVLLELTIVGKSVTGCVVDIALVNEQAATTEPYVNCIYSPETLALLTDQVSYLEAEGLDAGELNLDSQGNPVRAQTLANAVAAECSAPN